MHINVNEATIRTATVTVRTLAISGKQVTLSVFKQLQDSDLIEALTGEMIGQPWGKVNYFWKDCHYTAYPDPSSHLHVVWQQGEELRRSAVFPAPTLNSINAKIGNPVDIRQYVTLSSLAEQGKPGLGDPRWNRYPQWIEAGGERWESWVKGLGYDNRVVSEFTEELAEEGWGRSVDEALAIIHAGIAELKTIQDAWRESYRVCDALPQLFIAV